MHQVEPNLDLVVLRLSLLLDSPGTREVRADFSIVYGDLARSDVASTLVEIIEHPEVKHVIIELTQGDMPVGQAI